MPFHLLASTPDDGVLVGLGAAVTVTGPLPLGGEVVPGVAGAVFVFPELVTPESPPPVNGPRVVLVVGIFPVVSANTSPTTVQNPPRALMTE
jgi:hypothetical protein